MVVFGFSGPQSPDHDSRMSVEFQRLPRFVLGYDSKQKDCAPRQLNLLVVGALKTLTRGIAAYPADSANCLCHRPRFLAEVCSVGGLELKVALSVLSGQSPLDYSYLWPQQQLWVQFQVH
jgi:hypothetical protein